MLKNHLVGMIYRRVWKKRFRQMIIGMFCCSYKWQMPSSYALIMDSVSYVIIVLGSSESSTLRRPLFCTGVDGEGEFSLGAQLKRLQMLLVLNFLLCMITKLIKECIKFLIITNNGEENCTSAVANSADLNYTTRCHCSSPSRFDSFLLASREKTTQEKRIFRMNREEEKG